MEQNIYIVFDTIDLEIIGAFVDVKVARQYILDNLSERKIEQIKQNYNIDIINNTDWDMFGIYTDYDIIKTKLDKNHLTF